MSIPKAKSIILTTGLILIILMVIILTANLNFLNKPTKLQYPVRGVDVSAYQGEINWLILSSQGIQFAYIKATEGSSHIDKRFSYNLRNALKTNLRIGAYHFFSYDSSGATQAKNFIENVPIEQDMLPPVVDIEFYGNKATNLPDKDKVKTELQIMLDMLEEHYGKKPIIYATNKSYSLYIAKKFKDYDIWIRNVHLRPSLSDNSDWTFWQYTDREILKGYYGAEKYIDMNVFNGTQEEFNKY